MNRAASPPARLSTRFEGYLEIESSSEGTLQVGYVQAVIHIRGGVYPRPLQFQFLRADNDLLKVLSGTPQFREWIFLSGTPEARSRVVPALGHPSARAFA